jgi:hypothetical protein
MLCTINYKIAYKLESSVLRLAFESSGGFFVDKATSRKKFDCMSSVSSDESNVRIVDLRFRTDGLFSFVKEGAYSVEDVLGSREFDILVHAAT